MSVIKKISHFFNRAANEVSDLYDFRTITETGLDEFPDGLKQLKKREIDGFIVKGALTKEETAAIDTFTRTKGSQKEDVSHHPKGFVYPPPFSNLGLEIPNTDEYFRIMTKVRKNISTDCGVNIEEVLFRVLNRISGGREVTTPSFENGTSCMPYSLRYLKPDGGKLEVHCGNLFHGNHSAFYDIVNKSVETFDQLSFIFVIQPSESSDLILLDRTWKEGQHKENFEEVYSFIDENGKKVDCSDKGIDRMTIRLEPGDFLTFAGGDIWHVVEEVRGEKGRITIGGFMGFSHDDKVVYCWS